MECRAPTTVCLTRQALFRKAKRERKLNHMQSLLRLAFLACPYQIQYFQLSLVIDLPRLVLAHTAGTIFGLCNTFGSLSGIVGVTAVGFIVEATKSFATVFQLTAGLYVLGTIAWHFMCVGEKVFD